MLVLKLSWVCKVVSKFFQRFSFRTFVTQGGVDVLINCLNIALIQPVSEFRADLPELLSRWFDRLFYYIDDRIEILLSMGVVDDSSSLRDLKRLYQSVNPWPQPVTFVGAENNLLSLL